MKVGKKSFAVILGAMLVLSGAACGRADDSLNGPKDESKTQLYVFNFDGGYGSEWLKQAKVRFEEAYADVCFEPGVMVNGKEKRGVEINIDPQKLNGSQLKDRILGSTNEIFFNEYTYYDDYVKAGLCLDLSDIVNEKLEGEDRSIADKMTQQQLDYLTHDGKIYMIPHYAGYDGIVYNVDFFNSNNLYFREGWTDKANPFTANVNERTAGPDNQKGTEDDGLPTTFEEFYTLCDYIANEIPGAKPLLWNGVAYKDYLTALIGSVYINYEGKDQVETFYTMNGTVENAVVGVSDGEVSVEEIPVTPSENGYEVYGQAGKYYGTEFVSTILNHPSWYDSASGTVFSNSYSQLEAQKNFLYSSEFGGTTDYAMLIDGGWWESECDTTITSMVQRYGESASKYTRKFGWMPLPRPEASDAPYTMMDSIYSFGFIKSNIDESKILAAKTFLQFINTDESLIEFTKITNTTKALSYTMEESDKQELSNFGRSLMNMQEKSDIIFPYYNSPVYYNNSSKFTRQEIFSTTIDGTPYGNPIEPLRNGKSALEVFNGYKIYGKTVWDGMTK